MSAAISSTNLSNYWANPGVADTPHCTFLTSGGLVAASNLREHPEDCGSIATDNGDGNTADGLRIAVATQCAAHLLLSGLCALSASYLNSPYLLQLVLYVPLRWSAVDTAQLLNTAFERGEPGIASQIIALEDRVRALNGNCRAAREQKLREQLGQLEVISDRLSDWLPLLATDDLQRLLALSTQQRDQVLHRGRQSLHLPTCPLSGQPCASWEDVAVLNTDVNRCYSAHALAMHLKMSNRCPKTGLQPSWVARPFTATIPRDDLWQSLDLRELPIAAARRAILTAKLRGMPTCQAEPKSRDPPSLSPTGSCTMGNFGLSRLDKLNEAVESARLIWTQVIWTLLTPLKVTLQTAICDPGQPVNELSKSEIMTHVAFKAITTLMLFFVQGWLLSWRLYRLRTVADLTRRSAMTVFLGGIISASSREITVKRREEIERLERRVAMGCWELEQIHRCLDEPFEIKSPLGDLLYRELVDLPEKDIHLALADPRRQRSCPITLQSIDNDRNIAVLNTNVYCTYHFKALQEQLKHKAICPYTRRGVTAIIYPLTNPMRVCNLKNRPISPKSLKAMLSDVQWWHQLRLMRRMLQIRRKRESSSGVDAVLCN